MPTCFVVAYDFHQFDGKLLSIVRVLLNIGSNCGEFHARFIFVYCIEFERDLIVNKHWINIRRTAIVYSCECSGDWTVDRRWCRYISFYPLLVTARNVRVK